MPFLFALNACDVNRSLERFDLEVPASRNLHTTEIIRTLAKWIRTAAGSATSVRLCMYAPLGMDSLFQYLTDGLDQPPFPRLLRLELSVCYYNVAPAFVGFLCAQAPMLQSFAYVPWTGHGDTYAAHLDALPTLPVLNALTLRVFGDRPRHFSGSADATFDAVLRVLARGAGAGASLREVSLSGSIAVPDALPPIATALRSMPGVSRLHTLRVPMNYLDPELAIATLRGLAGVYPLNTLVLACVGWPIRDASSSSWHKPYAN
jgi:hypothetical protein